MLHTPHHPRDSCTSLSGTTVLHRRAGRLTPRSDCCRARIGRIDVVWVAHLSSTVMLSADAIAELEAAFDELEPELRAQAAGQLCGRGADWEFERRQGVIANELIAVAAGIRENGPGQSAVIVIGGSSNASHRMAGSVAVDLARHSPVPLVIVP
jgi:nucleotide-binding universal stress UspA family protein